jgi:hypothetical protein
MSEEIHLPDIVAIANSRIEVEGTCLVAKYKEMREYMKEGKVELQR